MAGHHIIFSFIILTKKLLTINTMFYNAFNNINGQENEQQYHQYLPQSSLPLQSEIWMRTIAHNTHTTNDL